MRSVQRLPCIDTEIQLLHLAGDDDDHDDDDGHDIQ